MNRIVKLLFLVCALSVCGSRPLFAGTCEMSWEGYSGTPFGNQVSHDSGWETDWYSPDFQSCLVEMDDGLQNIGREICSNNPASNRLVLTADVYFDGGFVNGFFDDRTCRDKYGLNRYNTLTAGQTINRGGAVGSPSGQYTLAYQTDGNLVLYRGSTPVWAINCWPTCRPGAPAGHAIMQSDGNFVVYDSSGTAVWWSGTFGSGAYLAIRDDGGLAVYSSNGATLWHR
jgi:hypothetical protein